MPGPGLRHPFQAGLNPAEPDRACLDRTEAGRTERNRTEPGGSGRSRSGPGCNGQHLPVWCCNGQHLPVWYVPNPRASCHRMAVLPSSRRGRSSFRSAFRPSPAFPPRPVEPTNRHAYSCRAYSCRASSCRACRAHGRSFHSPKVVVARRVSFAGRLHELRRRRPDALSVLPRRARPCFVVVWGSVCGGRQRTIYNTGSCHGRDGVMVSGLLHWCGWCVQTAGDAIRVGACRSGTIVLVFTI